MSNQSCLGAWLRRLVLALMVFASALVSVKFTVTMNEMPNAVAHSLKAGLVFQLEKFNQTLFRAVNQSDEQSAFKGLAELSHDMNANMYSSLQMMNAASPMAFAWVATIFTLILAIPLCCA